MSKKGETLQKGDKVSHEKYGNGVIREIGFVELPSDGDKTFYVVEFENGEKRNLKASQLD